MNISLMKCPSCGSPLPESSQPNQLFRCPACNATLFITDWKIGETKDAVVVPTPNRLYTVANLLTRDDLCNVYRCTFKADGKEWQGMFRIARDTEDNDLVQNEARTLYSFAEARNYADFRPFLPSVLESFLYQDASSSQARQVNILSLHEQIASPNELYTLEEVHTHYGGGIHAKDMAWMWRRVLNILGYIHANGVVHGAVLPMHILIEPRDHKLALTGWGYAVRDAIKYGKRLTAISTTYEAWYPAEVFERKPPTPGLDLLTAARTMLYLIGADPLAEATSANLEAPFQQHFARCLQADPAKRPQDAWELLDDFDAIIAESWGPRSFRPFTMPYKA